MLLRRTLRMIMVPALAVALLGTAESAGATAQAEATGRQLLFYNHSYGVFDRETADAIEHSTYLREFANFQVRTTTGTGGAQWTGRYLMGRSTYVELFGVGDLPGNDATLGAAGLGLGTDHDGDIDRVVDALPAEGVPHPIVSTQTRDFGDGVPVPWFDGVLTTDTYDAFTAWAMEYRGEYFADPRGGTDPATFPGDVSRERYLSDLYRDHLMRDVTSVRIAVTRGDFDDTVPLLRAGGFVVLTRPSGVVAVRGGTTIRLDVTPREQTGVKQFEFSLNHTVFHRHVEQLGHSTLVVGPGPRAVWTFG